MIPRYSSKSTDWRGFTILSVLMAVMIIGILSGMYLSPPGGGAEGGPAVIYPQRAKMVACQANRNVVSIKATEYQLTYGHYPSITELENAPGASVPRCPEGGKYYILDGQVYCTVHTEITIPTAD